MLIETGISINSAPTTVIRHAGVPQAAVLLAAVTLPVMGVISLVPVVPALQAHFADVPGANYLVPIALTIPGMCIALLSPFAGMLADRFGRRQLLLTALAFYGLFGLLPLLLDSLPLIIASRFGLGVTEAVIMTVTTTLTGDYFKEEERQKWVAAQAVAGSLAATLLFLAGGALGDLGWQAPFYLYGLHPGVLCRNPVAVGARSKFGAAQARRCAHFSLPVEDCAGHLPRHPGMLGSLLRWPLAAWLAPCRHRHK